MFNVPNFFSYFPSSLTHSFFLLAEYCISLLLLFCCLISFSSVFANWNDSRIFVILKQWCGIETKRKEGIFRRFFSLVSSQLVARMIRFRERKIKWNKKETFQYFWWFLHSASFEKIRGKKMICLKKALQSVKIPSYERFASFLNSLFIFRKNIIKKSDVIYSMCLYFI